jgi:hypothetical protein
VKRCSRLGEDRAEEIEEGVHACGG